MEKKELPKKFGKKKTKNRAKKELICVEPIRKSVYEVLLENMSILQRNIFVHRIIYIGNHNFPQGDTDTIGQCFLKNINYTNNFYCEEYLTGFLLHYSKYFIHVLDGSEESIRKHLHRLFTNSKTKDHLHTVKLLAAYHNINQRFINSWVETSAKPPQLIQKINPDLEAEEVRNKIAFCISKLYKCGYLLRNSVEEPNKGSDELAIRRKMRASHFEGLEDATGLSRRSIAVIRKSTVISTGSPGGWASCIPEVQLMEFLIETSYTLDLQEYYLKLYGPIPPLVNYTDKCFPVQTDYIPRNIFDDDYDPVTDIAEPDTSSDTDQVNIQ